MIKWFKKAIDWLFPIRCAGCQLEDVFCCQDCWAALEYRTIQECPYCRRGSLTGEVCQNCLDKSQGNLSGLIIAMNYQKQSLLAKSLYYYKYDQMPEYGEILKKILLTFWQLKREWFEENIDLITWIPMTDKKLQMRGFNQSEQLAKSIDAASVVGMLEKNRESQAQMSLNRQYRLLNLKGAFQLKKSLTDQIRGKSILIVDDIATTLSTLEEAALVLKKSGAKKVYGFVLARQKN